MPLVLSKLLRILEDGNGNKENKGRIKVESKLKISFVALEVFDRLSSNQIK